MTIEDGLRGVRLAHDEAVKSKLTGQVVITLSYHEGGLAKASKQVMGPLFPGARGPDRPAQDFEGRKAHGG